MINLTSNFFFCWETNTHTNSQEREQVEKYDFICFPKWKNLQPKVKKWKKDGIEKKKNLKLYDKLQRNAWSQRVACADLEQIVRQLNVVYVVFYCVLVWISNFV